MRAAPARKNDARMNERSDRLFTRAFVTLTLSELAYFTSAGLIIGVTPFFVTGPVGGDEAGLGLVAASFAMTALLLRPYAGRIADRRGRRPLLVAGATLVAVVMLAHLLTTNLVALVALRLLLGVAEAFYFVAAIAALVDLAPRDRTGEAISVNSLALYLGLALGPLLGQLLLDRGGFGAAWIGGSLLAAAATALAFRVPETATTATPGSEREGAPLIHRAAIGPGLALFTGVAAMSAFLLLAGPHAEANGLEGWSLTFLLFGSIVVGLRLAFARLPDRVAPMRLASAALALCATGLVTMAVWGGVAGLLAGTALLAAGVAFMTPALFAATFERVAPAERGSASGTTTLFIDLGFGGGPVVAGLVAAGAGVPAAFAVAGAVALAGAVGTALTPRFGRIAASAT